MRRILGLICSVSVCLGILFSPAWADFESGLRAYANGDFDQAAREFSLLAQQGDKEGQYYLGLLYEEGQGVPKLYEEAVSCYRRSALQGFVDAYFALGEIYLHQPGGKKDRVAAYYWLDLAARHGHPRGPEEFERNKKAMSAAELDSAEKNVAATH